jgi:hypothetical protein
MLLYNLFGIILSFIFIPCLCSGQEASDRKSQKELLQTATTKEHYFKLLITPSDDGTYERVSGVKIFEKKTDKLIQQIDLECDWRGIDDLMVNDYNFDGLEDFSVFETSYAGPNSTRIYILRSRDSDNYFISEITGISLEFDPVSKTILERNQCCAGKKIMLARYKLKNDKMVLVEKKCMDYDEVTEEFIDVICEE